MLRIKWWDWEKEKIKSRLDDFYQPEVFINKYYNELLGKNDNYKSHGKMVTAAEAVVINGSVNIMDCVNYFECGAENIYLLDESGLFSGRTAVREHGGIFVNSRGEYSLDFEEITSIIFDKSIDYENLYDLMTIGEKCFEEKDFRELPIVSSLGRLRAVVKREPIEKTMLTDWRTLDKWPETSPQGKLYMSSFHSHLLNDFWKVWQGKLDIEVLSNSNYKKALRDETGTLIYMNDIFPNTRKMSIWELGWRFDACMK